jgi:ABC-type dipeptide/oligopeptide/nickel transport system permease subunit
VLALGLVVVLGLGIAIVVPDLGAIIAAFQLWWLAVTAGVIIALASLGTWLFLRSAIIR